MSFSGRSRNGTYGPSVGPGRLPRRHHSRRSRKWKVDGQRGADVPVRSCVTPDKKKNKGHGNQPTALRTTIRTALHPSDCNRFLPRGCAGGNSGGTAGRCPATGATTSAPVVAPIAGAFRGAVRRSIKHGKPNAGPSSSTSTATSPSKRSISLYHSTIYFNLYHSFQPDQLGKKIPNRRRGPLKNANDGSKGTEKTIRGRRPAPQGLRSG